jgi:hypothetical protein
MSQLHWLAVICAGYYPTPHIISNMLQITSNTRGSWGTTNNGRFRVDQQYVSKKTKNVENGGIRGLLDMN